MTKRRQFTVQPQRLPSLVVNNNAMYLTPREGDQPPQPLLRLISYHWSVTNTPKPNVIALAVGIGTTPRSTSQVFGGTRPSSSTNDSLTPYCRALRIPHS